ncbi:MAG: protein kinase [Nitrospirae bacterium]|nr:protein kinase [Nitrospirota bacterium]
MSNKLFSGKYEIQGEIARGGMGVIYKAIHTTLNRRVAIKVLHPQYSGDSAFLKRFQREARAMARLDHENIIRVFDVAEDQGSQYIVMEYFQGKDLKQLILEKGRFLPEDALAFAVQVASALSYAHSQGIVHRDIKPGNIMVDGRGRVKIADFGIAAATDEISVTATGQIIGTPEYMSPEQARGEHLDGRTDLYSLGMVIFEMLNGQTPYQGISRMAIVGKLLYEKEELTLSFPSDTPLPVQDFVRTILKKQPGQRIQDAEAVITQIKALTPSIGGLPRTDPPGTTIGLQKAPAPPEEEGPTVMLHDAMTGTPSPISKTSTGTRPDSASAAQPLSRPIFEPVSPPKSAVTPPPLQPVAPRVKRPGLIPFIIGGAGVIILIGGLLYFLSSIGSKTSSLTVSDQKEEEGSIPLTKVREIQIAVREMQDRLSTARSEAEGANAKTRAPEIYQRALDQVAKGSQALQEGAGLINQKQYESASTSLQQALDLLSQARDGFVRARETASAKIAEEQTIRAEQEKLKKARAEQERLKKTRAEQEKLKETQAEQERSAKTGADTGKTQTTRPDIDVVGEILSNFKRAYENHDMRALGQISEMSEGRLRFLQQIFRDYSSITISITDFSLTGESASAVVSISHLADKSGNRVVPGDEWKRAKVVIKKQRNQWGKVIW